MRKRDPVNRREESHPLRGIHELHHLIGPGNILGHHTERHKNEPIEGGDHTCCMTWIDTDSAIKIPGLPQRTMRGHGIATNRKYTAHHVRERTRQTR